MKRVIMKTRIVISVFTIVLVLALAMAGAAEAALPAPTWLPGQPMLAGNQVIAMWLPVPGAVKYIVYLNGGKVMELPANQLVVPAPSKGGEYKYEITALDSAGSESPRSKPGLIKIIMLDPPADLITRQNPEDKSVSIRWKSSLGSVFTNVYRADSRNGPWKLLESVQTDKYKASNLEIGKEFWFSVTSKDVSGKESNRSEPVMVKLEELKVSKQGLVKIDMVVIPSNEVDRLISIGTVPVSEADTVKRTSDGELWIATGAKGTVLVVDEETFELKRRFDFASMVKEAGYRFRNATDITILEGL